MIRIVLAAGVTAFTLVAQTAAPHPTSSPRFDPTTVDKSVDPCDNFYQYACGNWKKQNPIPADQSRWGRFSEIAERNRDILRGILEDAAKPDASRDAVTQKIGDYYAACMDTQAIDARGTAPFQPELERIRNLKDKSELAAEVAHLQKIGVGVLFSFSSGQDFKDSTAVIAQADQGGLGLPDRDYYFKDDAKSVEIRKAYVEHVAKMFELLGETPEAAKADADDVMKFETALAQGSMDNVSRRDPTKVYHLMAVKELEGLAPSFAWQTFFTDSGSPKFDKLNVAVPDFFKAMNAQIESASLDLWKKYLTWMFVHNEAGMGPSAFVDENFHFYGKTLTGATEMRPRWKRCVDYTDNELGEALGQKFVEKTFGKEGKERTLQMVDQLEKALGQDIQTLTWMTPATKKMAEAKLKEIRNKIGYPDKWRDYSSVVIKRDDPLGNSMRADEFEFERQLNKIGKPVDLGEWFMTPPTVNAYYDPQMNNINFPAGILQPPFFQKDMDDAVNYGGIGMIIGHELTHGFDDQGSQFDGQGNLKNWWTPTDQKEFDSREACIAKEYSSFEVAPGLDENGKLTLGENTADNGGLRIALMALENSLAGKSKPVIGGFTPEQRFFLAFGQSWCENDRPEAERLQVTTDPHSLPRFRVNGVIENMPEFSKAFACKAGAKMAPVNACHVW